METEDTESCSGIESEHTDTLEPLLCWSDDGQSQPGGGGGEFIDEINATNAKKFALLLVLALIGYHGLLHWTYGRDSCKWILSDGRFKGDMGWQPYGCMMHQYSQVDTKKCMKYLSFWDHNNDFLFIGDSRIHDLYVTFVRHFAPNYKTDPGVTEFNNTLYMNENLNLNVKFIWSPYVGDLMYNTLNSLKLAKRSNANNTLYMNENLNLNVKFIWSPYVGDLMYNTLNSLKASRDSCKWILSDGRFKGDMGWQPYGCMMHQYSQVDTKKCMKYLSFWDHNNDFLFIGDSRIHDLYVTFVRHFAPNYKTDPGVTEFNNTLYMNENLNLNVKFIWSPYVGDLMYNTLNSLKNIDRPPSMILLGAGTWSMQQYNATALDHITEYSANLSRLVEAMDILSERKSRVIWNLQESVNEKKLSPEYEMITNQLIDAYNKAAIETLSSSDVIVWSSSRLVASGKLDEMRLGFHVAPQCLDIHVQLLLNVYCNDHMNFNDATCCSTPEQYSALQVLVYTGFLICIILTAILTLKQSVKFLYEEPTPMYIVISSLGKLGLILTYFYLCDRTNFFMKENKYYSQVSFWLPIGYVFVLGVFFTEDSRYIKILNRDQTDEWKGCMQLILVISHMTGARTQLPILNHMRIFASSYLFISGFGHFYYMWHRPDSGLVRYLQVLFRLNGITILCCVAMNRPYQFYHFVPLVTFWFSLLYLILQVPPRGNGNARYLYVSIKLLVLFGLVAVLYISEVFFEKVFVTRPWKALFVTTDDDIHDWWTRWKLDRYSFLYGCVFSLSLILIQKFNLIDDNTYSNLFSTKVTLVALFVAIGAICLNSTFAMLCSEAECTELHSYTVIIPILSYIVVRNISGRLRTRYSSLFAGLGRISLELYITQIHIFTSADTHGILTLLPEYPVLNSLVTCFIFICVAHEVSDCVCRPVLKKIVS
ncbi:N-acetylneuraminate 9-O-acetyltransferase [Diaphorina citri]|uniref:N-acetylneuraminate 9-O-acetyltransferase n=1 Tax=Diaphorina citri TaxID=121845 RepID=A0A3Q0J6S7_DIACI|nr:N-acetylneuraminate 9-O-acetyltransferase [Diaphorina citri]